MDKTSHRFFFSVAIKLNFDEAVEISGIRLDIEFSASETKLGNAVAYLFLIMFMKETIMTKKIARRGVKV